MLLPRLAIFIDAQYLNNIKGDFGFERVDIRLLAHNICKHIEACCQHNVSLTRIYYYDCIDEGNGGQQQFISTVKSWPHFQVRLGKLGWATCSQCNRSQVKQKRVDGLLTVDIVSLSLKHMITHAAIVAGDSDFIPAIDTARNEGISTWLFYGDENSCHKELVQSVDVAVPLHGKNIITPYSRQ